MNGERDGHREEMVNAKMEPGGEVVRGSRRNETTVVHSQLLGGSTGHHTVSSFLPGLCTLAVSSHALGSGPKKGANLTE